MTLLDQPIRVEWYYIYLPELGTDPLTVTLFTKRVPHEGLLLVFDGKLAVQIEVINLTNPLHPFIIAVPVDGELRSLNLDATRKQESEYRIQRFGDRQVSLATKYRRRVGLWRGHLRSYCNRLIWPTNRNRSQKIGCIDGKDSILLRI
jgi:hypothetical protein